MKPSFTFNFFFVTIIRNTASSKRVAVELGLQGLIWRNDSQLAVLLLNLLS